MEHRYRASLTSCRCFKRELVSRNAEQMPSSAYELLHEDGFPRRCGSAAGLSYRKEQFRLCGAADARMRISITPPHDPIAFPAQLPRLAAGARWCLTVTFAVHRGSDDVLPTKSDTLLPAEVVRLKRWQGLPIRLAAQTPGQSPKSKPIPE